MHQKIEGERPPHPLHRIKQVRRLEQVSLRSVARRIKVKIRVLQKQEDACTDLRLSELYRWQRALNVPACELLEESCEALSAPIQQRARLLRLARTVHSLLAKSPTPKITRLAQIMVEQLCELMPELEQVKPWCDVGQRNSPKELGRITEHIVDITDSDFDFDSEQQTVWD